MKLLASIAFIAAALALSPRMQCQENNDAQPSYRYSCTKLPYVSAGCNSYNQMIESNDSDVISAIKTFDAYVCFVQDADEFFIVSFQPPADEELIPSQSHKGILEMAGTFSYSKYKDGVSDDTVFLFGTWTKIKNMSVAPSFFTQQAAGENGHASVTDTEVGYDNSFQNLSGTKTTYVLQIRRSTLRFNQTYTYPESSGPAPRKNGTPTPQPAKSQDRISETGQCAEFK